MAKFMLPIEIWHHIFSYLDEKSLRTVASSCKLFFELVRGNEKLSGCIILKSVVLKDLATKIKSSEWIWDRWPSLKTLKIPIHFEKIPTHFEYLTGIDQSTEKEVFDLIRGMKFETSSSLEKVVVFNCCWSIQDFPFLRKRFPGLHHGYVMEFSFHPKNISLMQSLEHITVYICQICIIRYGKGISSYTKLQTSEKHCKTCLKWCLS